MKRTTILIADDHKMFAEGLASFAEKRKANWEQAG